ncbi:hypothetical protein GCM10009751_19160 [Myceligenerans crystallogenes]|uniref:Uncharacterized protein n=1 Tax=Myceligenerans crystallogenes TaxID=316335 RepID=A0ABN2NBD0_9MICO
MGGSSYSYADSAGLWLHGATAGVVPILIGLGLCVPILYRSGISWPAPSLLVASCGAIGAVLGATERFPEGASNILCIALFGLAMLAAVGFAKDVWVGSR